MTTKVGVRAGAAAVLGMALLVSEAVPAGAQERMTEARTSEVQVAQGRLQGKTVGGVGQFLGVPFAAPPVGARRWMPPAEPASWTGTRDATKFGNHCAQAERGIFAMPGIDEDCLYLNVFTPTANPDGAGRLPVMVWFYGGGLFSGDSNSYDGSRLTKRGNVIVVTTNYRVGALGFFSHPAINGEGHPYANYGIMDHQAALRWVKANIAAFGGNPDNVTIFGQSGGGTAVMANIASPTAKGLFHRAINQSGTRIKVTTPDEALKAGQEFATRAGCADQSAACLRALPVEDVLKHQAPILRYVTEFPSVDGTVITHSAPAAFESGNFNRVPIMTGLVQDEEAYFMAEHRDRKAMTSDDLQKYVLRYGAANKDAITGRYPPANYPSPSLAAIAIAQGAKVSTARMLDRSWAKYVPVYAYEFRDRTTPSYFAPVSYPMGAYHTAELLYLFENFHGARGTPHALNAEQEKLSDLMIDYWSSFAREGAPVSRRDNARSEWARYTPEADNIQVLDLSGAAQETGYGKRYNGDLWDGIAAD